MVLWQFITLSALIAAVLVYAIVITLRLGRADARLNKIEDALAFLTLSRSSESTDTQRAEAAPEESGGKEVSGGGGYLTIRDLRARSAQMGSRTTRPDFDNAAAAQEMRAAWKMTRSQMKAKDPDPERVGDTPAPMSEPLPQMESSVAPLTSSEPAAPPAIEATDQEPEATSIESHDEPAESSDPLSLPAMDAMSESPTPQSVESHEEPAANGEPPQNPPDSGPPGEDSLARKNQETVLFLNSQRRRRRERLGY